MNKFFFIDQDSYWIQPNDCLNSDKFHLVEKGNLVLNKSICRSMEHSYRIITRNECKASYTVAMTFQLNNTDFPVLPSKYAFKAIYGCTKVPSSIFISNVVAKYVRKFVCVLIFAQRIFSPSYRVAKRSDFVLVNKVIINIRRSVCVSRKDCLSLITYSRLNRLRL